MSCHDEVIRIGKKLEKMITAKNLDDTVAANLLNELKKQKMTLDVLQKSRIGMSVNSYRKLSKNDEVVSVAKSLIKNWKKLLDNSSSTSTSLSRSTSTSSSLSRSNSAKIDEGDSQSRDRSPSPNSGSPRGREDSPNPAGGSTLSSGKAGCMRDSTRLKCRDMIASALRNGEIVDGCGDIDMMATETEEHIYQEFKNTDMKYVNRIRSRIANLKDTKNPRFRENVLLGHIPPARLAVMTSEDMASDAMKLLRAKLTKESIDDHQMSTQSGTKSDLFKCGRCGQRDTSYNQLQTRSSDEPMTTFVLCNHCGNRWKFC